MRPGDQVKTKSGLIGVVIKLEPGTKTAWVKFTWRGNVNRVELYKADSLEVL